MATGQGWLEFGVFGSWLSFHYKVPLEWEPMIDTMQSTNVAVNLFWDNCGGAESLDLEKGNFPSLSELLYYSTPIVVASSTQ
jgi:hypothetical protein